MRTIWYTLGWLLAKIYALLMLRLSVERASAFPPGAKIIVVNHPSTIDPILVTTLTAEPTSILINGLLFKVPLLGRSLRWSGHIPVNAGEGSACLDEAVRYLEAGRTVVVFPEGAISPVEGGFGKAHTGAARLALLTGAPVIPVGIALDRSRLRIIESQVDGKPEVGTWYFQGPYAMSVGQPVTYHGSVSDRERVRDVTELLMQRIDQMANWSEMRIKTWVAEVPPVVPLGLPNLG